MLPDDLPNARILAFGYQSNWLGNARTNTRLGEIANELLTALEVARQDCHDRPIILIGHCFGGIVIEKALVDASGFRNNFSSLLGSIAGVICMGTPHQGTGSHGAVAAIARAGAWIGLATESRVLESLNPLSEILEDTVKRFAEASYHNHWPVHCFYEAYPTNHNKVISKHLRISAPVLLVDEDSACLKSWGRNKLASDHFDLNKFSSPDDPNYLSLRHVLMKMARGKYFSSVPRTNSVYSPSSLSSPPQSLEQDLNFINTVPMQRNHTFHGRKDILWKLDQIFSKSANEYKGAALSGLGGIGKTQIALEWAYQSLPTTHVLWANGRSIETLQESFLEIGKEAGFVYDTSSKGEAANRVKNWLDSTSSGDWRLIVDNVDDQTSKHVSIKPLLPVKRGKLLLVGCMADDLGTLVEHNCQVKVPPWSLEEAATMLLKFADLLPDPKKPAKDSAERRKEELRKEEALNLADKLGCIPLAIAQAAAYIRKNPTSIKEYTAHLFPLTTQEFSNNADLLAKVVGGPSDLIPQAVAVTWDYSYKRLETQAPYAAKLIHFLSYLSPDGILLKILNQKILQESCSAGDDFNLIEELGYLRSFAMIQMTSSSEEADVDSFTIRLPVLVSLWVRKTKISPADNKRLTEKAFQLIAEQFPIATATSPSAGSHLASHVQAVLHHRRSIDAKATELSKQLDYRFGRHQYFTGHFKDARDLLMSHFNHLKDLPGKELELAVCAYFTARSLDCLGDERTEDWYDQAFDLGKELPSQPDFNVWDNLSWKADFVSKKADYERAINILSDVLKNYNISAQTVNKIYILPLQLMAEIYQRLKKPDMALEHWSQALALSKEEFATSPERAMSLVLGKVVSLRQLGRIKEAEGAINSYAVDLLGDRNLEAKANRAPTQASDNLEKAFPILNRFHRQNTRDLINFKDFVADIHIKEGHPLKALNWRIDAYAQAISYYGEDNVVTVYIHAQLISAFDGAGLYEEAMKHLCAYIKTKESQKNGPLMILRLKSDLIRLKLLNGSGIDAIKLGSEVHTELDKICSKEDYEIVECESILAETYLETGFPKKAIELSRKALERSEGIKWMDDEWKATPKRTLGRALADLGQYIEAETTLHESSRGFLGTDEKLEEILTRIELAKVMSKTKPKDASAALRICHDALEQIKSLSDHPSGHTSTWAIWYAEGICYSNTSNPQQALTSFRNAEECASAHMLDGHPYRIAISLNIAHALMALPQPADQNLRFANYRKAKVLYDNVLKKSEHTLDSGSSFISDALDGASRASALLSPPVTPLVSQPSRIGILRHWSTGR